jgi:hypothetical protein
MMIALIMNIVTGRAIAILGILMRCSTLDSPDGCATNSHSPPTPVAPGFSPAYRPAGCC